MARTPLNLEREDSEQRFRMLEAQLSDEARTLLLGIEDILRHLTPQQHVVLASFLEMARDNPSLSETLLLRIKNAAGTRVL